MSAESAITAALRADAPVLAIVPSARIAVDWLSLGNALPAIVFEREATEYTHTIHSKTPVLEKVTMEIWCLATTRLAADTLADKVMLAIDDDFLVTGRRSDSRPEAEYAAVVSADVWI